MEIWSAESGAFVDFADGYSYLPMIPRSFGVKREPIAPTDLSTVLHEFSHQLALNGPFGWMCAFFQSLRPITRTITEMSIQLDMGQAFFRLSETLRNKIRADYFTADYSNIVANYRDIIAAYRPLLEGIALFVQLDFQPSKTYEIGSDLYSFMAELILTEFEALNSPSLEDVFAYYEEVHKATLDSNLLQLVFEGTDPETNPYFVGYLLVKELQRILSEKDSRLADPEVYFIFLHHYLFYDSSILALCRVDWEENFQQYIKAHLTKVIQGVTNPNEDNLRDTVDLICDFQNKKHGIDVEFLDFAVLVRNGEHFSWQDQRFVNEIDDRIKKFTVTQTMLPDIYAALQNGTIDTSLIQDIIRDSVQLFRLLINIMPTFKLRHSRRAILDYYDTSRDDDVSVASIDLVSRDIYLSTIPVSRFESLKNKIANGEYIFAKNDHRLKIPPTNAKDFNDTLQSYDKQGKLLVLQDYDMYLIKGRERCRHLVLDDFTYTEPYHWERSQDSLTPKLRSEFSVQFLDRFGRFIHYETYLPLVMLVEFEHRPLDRKDKRFISEIHCNLWQTIFKNCQAKPKELDTFINKKFGVIAPQRSSERNLIQDLLHNKRVDATKFQIEISKINHRWRYFTGNNLIDNEGKLAI